IGIYSGTFDPIHVGHIAFAKEVARELTLDTVIFLPEQRPRGKQRVTDIHHRVELIKQSIQNDNQLQILSLPMQQFTVAETLPELQKHFANANLTFLIGSDIVRTFTYRWDGLETLLKAVTFAVGIRAGDNQDELETIFTQLETQYGVAVARSYIITENAHITSSQFRANEIDPSQLPHPAMFDYIRENQLYTGT
ncbi:MAG TPA: adenylyltransferase/cytidyltransferase family protein, partial [Patescibacteria group bacterium]|nr:adenylyltransferase/cytidyltransferase family protein [Patescibacteria group bacterium]